MNSTNQLAIALTSNIKKLKDLTDLYKQSYSKLKTLRKSVPSLQHSKTYEKEYQTCIKLCESRMNTANECYFLCDTELRKVNAIIERLELEQDSAKCDEFSFQNYLIDKNYDDILNFDNYLTNKKKAKNKKTKNAHKNMTLKLNTALTRIKNKRNNKQLLTPPISTKKGKLSITHNNHIDNNNSSNSNSSSNNNSNLEDITYKEIDGKIGPKEPIYCFCNYVSYGNMIKCDNPKCVKEWFHFHCVGLKNLPKGKWFCSEKCAEEFKSMYKIK